MKDGNKKYFLPTFTFSKPGFAHFYFGFYRFLQEF